MARTKTRPLNFQQVPGRDGGQGREGCLSASQASGASQLIDGLRSTTVKSLPSATPFRVQYRPSGRDESGRMSARRSG
jgi:hypothetical protein